MTALPTLMIFASHAKVGPCQRLPYENLMSSSGLRKGSYQQVSLKSLPMGAKPLQTLLQKSQSRPCSAVPAQLLQLCRQEGPAVTVCTATFYLHRANLHTSARSLSLFLISLLLKLSTGRCEESQVRAVTLPLCCSAFIPGCGGSRNSPRFPGLLANAAFTSKRSF